VRIVYTPLWQNVGNVRSARDFVQDEIELMELVEGLGFDATFSPEHHFDIDYSASPDNFLPLSYIAGRTTTLGVGLGAVILPWNNPLRVVEKLSMLDHLSRGRCIAGFGRGLSKVEYGGMGVAMSESRERFDESVRMVLEGLRTGVVQGDGPFYPQPRVEVHPKPRPELADDFYSVAMSPSSAVAAAEIGGRLLCFTTQDIEDQMDQLESYRVHYRQVQGKDPQPELLDDFFYVHDGSTQEREKGRQYAAAYYRTVVRHYEMAGDHFAGTAGYESYAAGAVALAEVGIDAAAQAYVDAQVGLGTPDEVLAKMQHRLDVAGPVDLGGSFFYGGMSKAEARASLELFGAEVVPTLRTLVPAQSVLAGS
jgi:alkanesulfonate monooxygenase SsuD/methylene tetrahydromethanopterin reductase-like flavin-dependent oxidoreductase (luciferase family)